jgi:Protein of unknown function (DUF3995)
VHAASLGTASATVSAYWALGGTALLDTAGRDIEQWGRERSPAVVAALWVIVVLKLVGAAAPLVFVGVGATRLAPWTKTRPARMGRGGRAHGLRGVLTLVGLLVEAGVFDAVDDADERALAWHAYLWDPWFARWEAAFAVAMGRSGPRVSA